MPTPPGLAQPLPPDVFEFVAPGTTAPAFRCPACQQDLVDVPRCPDCRLCGFCCNCRACGRCSEVTARLCQGCATCDNCCHCVECPRCHVQRERLCETCTGCVGRCCACFTCDRCGTRLPGGTPRHNATCINCYPNAFFFFNVVAPKFHEAVRIIDRKRNHSSRFLSGEIEISQYSNEHNPNTAKAVWKWGGQIVHDGSVSGGEINTAPAAGDHWLDQIDEICQALEKDGAMIGSSAGGHLHVDARDFSFFDIRRFIYLYEKIETSLFALVNPTRRSNDYCRAVGPQHIRRLVEGKMMKAGKDRRDVGKANKVAVISGLYGRIPDKHFAETRRDKSNGVRYQACNLHSWMHRGTIECRMMQGSMNPDDWQCWGMLWAGIMDFAMARTEKDIFALNRKSDLLMNDIAPNDRVRSWISWSRLRYQPERVVT